MSYGLKKKHKFFFVTADKPQHGKWFHREWLNEALSQAVPITVSH